MERILVFDIETVGVLIDELPLCQDNKEYIRGKVEKKRTLKSDERTDEEKEKDFCGFDPDLAKVICIGAYDGEKVSTCSVDKTHREPEVIRWFWELLEETNPNKLVTFNGKSFDIPIVVRRTIEYQLNPTKNLLSLERYDNTHTDIAEYLAGLTKEKLKTQDFYCDLFGIPKESGGFKGNEIRGLFEAGRSKDIEEKCGGDVKATYQLYMKIKPFLRR